MANTARDAKRKPTPYRAEDFMPAFDKTDPEPEDLAEKIKSIFGAMAAKRDGRPEKGA